MASRNLTKKFIEYRVSGKSTKPRANSQDLEDGNDGSLLSVINFIFIFIFFDIILYFYILNEIKY